MQTDDSGKIEGYFDIMALATTLPERASTMLADIYLTDRETASARLFRVYRPVPAHYHEGCDEFLYVLSGHGRFWIRTPAEETAFGPGVLLCFDRNTVHAISEIGEEPVVFLAIDTPRRAPDDVIFVDPADGDAKRFMARNREG